MTTPKADPLSVTCPRCGAPPATACNVGLYVYRPARRSHTERYAAARGK